MKWFWLIAFLLLSFSAAGVGQYVTYPALESWYPTVKKPSWNPPRWVFAPVWTTLYTMIALSGWLVWMRRGESDVTIPMTVFFLHLGLNALWSVLFFGWQQIGPAAVEIIVLLISIVSYILLTWNVSRWASLLFVPYALWVSFAAALNVTIWWIN